MKEYRFNKMAFFKTLVEGSIRRIKKGGGDLENFYNGNEMLIRNQIKSTPEREEECQELLEILDRTHRMFADPEVVEIIIHNNVTEQQFIAKYGERLLGDNKRKYDMSDKFNPHLIDYQDARKQKRKTLYVPREGKEDIYLNSEGREISIQEIGKLYFEEWNGVKNNVSKYRVMKQIGKGTYQEVEVFSNIRRIMMENPEYREAVLGELLSKNNIELSKTGGYIGEIEEASKEDKRDRIGSEKVVAGDYYYKVSPNYMLTYHSAEMAAVMIKEEKKQRVGKRGDIIDRKRQKQKKLLDREKEDKREAR